MIPTSTDVLRIFKEYNLKCFGNQLPLLPILCVRTKENNLGMFCCRSNAGVMVRGSQHIKLNTMYSVEMSTLITTVVHEMIHYYIRWKGIKDTDSHGPEFQRIANRINRMYNLHIATYNSDRITRVC